MNSPVSGAPEPATQFSTDARIYVWLEGDPAAHEPDAWIPDIPGVNDIDQLVDAIVRGDLGRFLPADLRYATHARPSDLRSIKTLDTVRLLRDNNIRHRRRYEIYPAGATSTPHAVLAEDAERGTQRSTPREAQRRDG